MLRVRTIISSLWYKSLIRRGELATHATLMEHDEHAVYVMCHSIYARHCLVAKIQRMQVHRDEAFTPSCPAQVGRVTSTALLLDADTA